MSIFSGKFTNIKNESIFFGAESTKSSLQTLFETKSLNRLFIVTTNSLSNSIVYNELKDFLGSKYVGEFTQIVQHTPISNVEELAEKIKNNNIHAVISFGGGSVIDAVKGALMNLDKDNPIPHIAIPTTLSGAEFTNYISISERSGVKKVYQFEKAAPSWVILDPCVTVDTPIELWNASGMKSFADCIEAFCSKKSNILIQNSAAAGLKLLNNHLLNSSDKNSDQMVNKCATQLAPIYALQALINSSGGLITAFRHQLGSKFGIPHGVASAIVMPYVLKWNLEYSKTYFAQLAKELIIVDINTNDNLSANAFLDRIDELLIMLNLNKKLREYVDSKSHLENIIESVLQSPMLGNNSRPIKSRDDLVKILYNAW